MASDTEDANETLFYLQDIFASGDDRVNRMLGNALLHYCFLPVVVRSLCALKPILSMNTCLYVLTQTFRIIRDPPFIARLFQALFANELPMRLQEAVEPKDGETPRSPSFYSRKY